MKPKITIIIYANPDYYPPLINAVNLLLAQFDLIIICRKQNGIFYEYPAAIKIYRLGKEETVYIKERKNIFLKFFEYISFIIGVFWLIRNHHSKLIYSYDMHGFVAGVFPSVLLRIKIIYHNLDFVALSEMNPLGSLVKRLELYFSRYAAKIIFPDIYRAKFFQREARLPIPPNVVLNAPLLIKFVPSNTLMNYSLKENQLPVDSRVVIYQGSINDSKCILEVIRSMVFWPKDFVFVLIGWVTREFQDKIDALSRSLFLEKRVIYISAITPYPKHLIYAAGAHLGIALVKPQSLNQRFIAGACNKIFEYLALGIPVITNETPPFKEILDSSFVYFIQTNSPEDIAKAVIQSESDNSEYGEKTRIARHVHLEKFNYEYQFKPILEYINGILN